MTAYERIRDALESGGYATKDNGHGRLRSQCPAHTSSTAESRPLAVTAIEGKALIYCHAGCDKTSVMAALSLTVADLFDSPKGAEYVYPGGRRTVYRTPDKKFRQKVTGTDRSLFHGDRIAAASHVYVTEGEQDVLAAEAVGAAAVSAAQGAGKAHLADWEPLRGKHVTVVADKDEPGRKHAEQVAGHALAAGAASVRIVTAAVGKDLADHIAAGKTLDELVEQDSPRTESAEGLPRLWRALDLKPAAPPRWLAKGRLPVAAISLLVGDEGIGKSLLWVLIASAVTTGKPLPEFGVPARAPGRVLLICTEDDWTSTVRPRLEVAGADLSMVDMICTEDDGSGAPIFPRDLHLIATADPTPALIVVDAWLDTVTAGLSVRDPQQARQALHPWKEVASATDASVLLLTHTNRVASTNPRDRYGATGELRKKARMTLFAQCDDDGNLVVGPEKMNTAAPIAASVFAIEAVQHFPASDDNDGTVPILSYLGESEMTAREHLAATAEVGGDEPGGNPAKAFIHEFLMAQTGDEALAADVLKAGRGAGFNEQELKDARRRHRKPRIESRKASFGDGWVWAIVHDEGGAPDEGGRKTPEGGVGGSEGVMPPGVPPTPPSPPSPPRHGAPPGGITGATPGYTERVTKALANAHSRAAAPSPAPGTATCIHCGEAIHFSSQVDSDGRPAHLSCAAPRSAPPEHRTAEGGPGSPDCCRYCGEPLPAHMASQVARGYCHRPACLAAQRNGQAVTA